MFGLNFRRASKEEAQEVASPAAVEQEERITLPEVPQDEDAAQVAPTEDVVDDLGEKAKGLIYEKLQSFIIQNGDYFSAQARDVFSLAADAEVPFELVFDWTRVEPSRFELLRRLAADGPTPAQQRMLQVNFKADENGYIEVRAVCDEERKFPVWQGNLQLEWRMPELSAVEASELPKYSATTILGQINHWIAEHAHALPEKNGHVILPVCALVTNVLWAKTCWGVENLQRGFRLSEDLEVDVLSGGFRIHSANTPINEALIPKFNKDNEFLRRAKILLVESLPFPHEETALRARVDGIFNGIMERLFGAGFKSEAAQIVSQWSSAIVHTKKGEWVDLELQLSALTLGAAGDVRPVLSNERNAQRGDGNPDEMRKKYEHEKGLASLKKKPQGGGMSVVDQDVEELKQIQEMVRIDSTLVPGDKMNLQSRLFTVGPFIRNLNYPAAEKRLGEIAADYPFLSEAIQSLISRMGQKR